MSDNIKTKYISDGSTSCPSSEYLNFVLNTDNQNVVNEIAHKHIYIAHNDWHGVIFSCLLHIVVIGVFFDKIGIIHPIEKESAPRSVGVVEISLMTAMDDLVKGGRTALAEPDHHLEEKIVDKNPINTSIKNRDFKISKKEPSLNKLSKKNEENSPASPSEVSGPSSKQDQSEIGGGQSLVNNDSDINIASAYAVNPQPVYPDASRRRREEGVVLLGITVGADGNVQAISIIKGSGYDLLDESAYNTVKNWRFNPAIRGGTATTSEIKLPIRFKLEQ